MIERFTDRARKVMRLAKDEARLFQHEHICTAHILLGILKEGSSAAVGVLRKLGVEPDIIWIETEKHILIGLSPVDLTYRLQPTPLAKKVIEYAMEEAREGGFHYVGAEHILLGLLRVDEGVAAQVLMHFGVTVDKVREQFRTSVDRLQSEDKPPEACPKCGTPYLVRVLWHCTHLFPQDQEDVDAGKAILGSCSDMLGPTWVCLLCSPAWSDVHTFAMQDYKLQRAKEDAVASMDFEAARKCLDAQVDLRRQYSEIVEGLLKDQ